MLNLLAITVSLAAQNAAGQAASPPPSDEIVVEGRRNQDRQINDFVDALTDTEFNGQLSRFDFAVCPAAVGLTDAQGAAIAARMRQVAKAAGIGAAPAGCKPNVLLIAARSKRETIEQLRKEHPAYFTEMSSGEVDALSRSSGPATAWHVEGRVDREGRQLAKDFETGNYVLEVSQMPSRLIPASRPQFVASVLVVELAALKGLTVTQIADYAAMRTFARTDPQAVSSGAPTILSILDAPMGTAVPVTMTEWDLGFLKALYSGSANRYASQQRGEMQRRLREDLKAQPEER